MFAMQRHLIFLFLPFIFTIDFGRCLEITHDVVNIYIFSRTNLETPTFLRSHNLSDLLESNFNHELKTYVVLHGAWDNHSSCLTVKNSLLTAGNFNLLLFDYMEPANNLNDFNNTVNGIGSIISDYLTLIVNHFGLTYNNFTCIGFSLGGQICGKVGLLLQGQLGEIIGLDAAGVSPSYINISSAKFVQNIRSSIIGLQLPYGHSNYYLNTNEQPGCDGNVECNHYRAMRYYEESLVSGGFTAYKCNSSESFETGLCDENETSYIGRIELDKSADGSYYLETNSESPFSMDSSSSNLIPVRNLKLLWLVLFSFIFLRK